MSVDRYAALLRRCGAHGTITEAKRLHSELCDRGFDRVTFLSNLLIQMYGSLGEMQQARSILAAMESPNIFSWNIMLSSYLRRGQMQQAKQLFAEMPPGSVVASNCMMAAYSRLGNVDEANDLFQIMKKRDDVTWNTLAAANAQWGHLEETMHILERVPAWNAISWNLMITAYTRNGALVQARRVFDQALEKDVVTWTSIIAGYAQDGHCIEALSLFREMDLEGVSPNNLTITSILDACANGGDLTAGRIIHDEVKTNPSLSFEDAGVGNALIHLYGTAGLTDEARRIFDLLPQRDVVSWTVLSTAYAQSGHLLQVKLMFDKMPNRDAVSWNCTISALAEMDAVDDADFLFRQCPHRSVVTWSSLIAANAHNGHFEKSLRLYREMLQDGTRPDRHTFTLALEACAALAEMGPGCLVHSHIVESGMPLSTETSTAIMHMYARCGNAAAAGELFEKLTPVLDGNDIVPWNVMMAMRARAGLHYIVMELFWRMAQNGHNPDEITSVAVLSACGHIGVIQAAIQCFQSLVGDFYVIPVVDHYICLMDAFGRAGLLEYAEELVRNMPFEADSLVWLAFLSSCRTHGDVERAKRALDWIVKLDEGTCSSAPYALLCNVFAG